MKTTILALLLSLSMAAPRPAPAAPEAEGVRAVVEDSVNAVLAALRDKALTPQARRDAVMGVIDPVLDFPLMAKLALGRKHWPELDAAQQKEFTQLFVRSLQDSYFEKMDLLTDEKVEFDKPEPAEKGKFQMMTTILSKGDRHKMLYKMYKKDSSWKVYDVEIAGISLVKSYGAQYDQFLRTGSVADLLKKLREKALGQPDELKAKKAAPAAQAGEKGASN